MSILDQHTDYLDPNKDYTLNENGQWIERKPRKPENKQKWFSIKEAAEFSGIKVSRIRWAISHGNLKATQLQSGIFVIAENDILDYKENPKEIRDEAKNAEHKQKKNEQKKARKEREVKPVNIDDLIGMLTQYVTERETAAYIRGFADGRFSISKEIDKIVKGETK